jgi:23S rRNA pseudouridine2605 synthase
MRLHRALARSGVASRRRAEELIRAGLVRVNGSVGSIGQQVDPDTDVITVRGRRVKPVAAVWIALHKPIGYVVTRKDPRGRPTVFSLLPDTPGLAYVGRLDVMTSGLLLLTTDGTAAHRLTHPRYSVERSYRALVHGRSLHDIRRELARPVVIDGRPVNIVRYEMAERQGSVELTLVLVEGRYRIVRRVCERLRLKVERLVRLSYGPIRLGRLAPGQWRHLRPGELDALRAMRAD